MKRTRYLIGGGTVTTEDITEEEFLKKCPNTIRIETPDDIKKLEKYLQELE